MTYGIFIPLGRTFSEGGKAQNPLRLRTEDLGF